MHLSASRPDLDIWWQTNKERSPTPKKTHLSKDDSLGVLDELCNIIADVPMIVPWDSTIFGRLMNHATWQSTTNRLNHSDDATSLILALTSEPLRTRHVSLVFSNRETLIQPNPSRHCRATAASPTPLSCRRHHHAATSIHLLPSGNQIVPPSPCRREAAAHFSSFIAKFPTITQPSSHPRFNAHRCHAATSTFIVPLTATPPHRLSTQSRQHQSATSMAVATPRFSRSLLSRLCKVASQPPALRKITQQNRKQEIATTTTVAAPQSRASSLFPTARRRQKGEALSPNLKP
ncbi:hypothetical protein LR48_Vigan661s003800 [Vigna angularis]|uniref:Uncharacterized protein n=1 Tax=Phaseolus angularis TaxID=3914 RepID=A0A0L9TG09_PHAAN|nr:hypothetical protein LR48_Vigan661s003800 [Vigna angularis]